VQRKAGKSGGTAGGFRPEQ